MMATRMLVGPSYLRFLSETKNRSIGGTSNLSFVTWPQVFSYPSGTGCVHQGFLRVNSHSHSSLCPHLGLSIILSSDNHIGVFLSSSSFCTRLFYVSYLLLHSLCMYLCCCFVRECGCERFRTFRTMLGQQCLTIPRWSFPPIFVFVGVLFSSRAAGCRKCYIMLLLYSEHLQNALLFDVFPLELPSMPRVHEDLRHTSACDRGKLF